MVAATSLLAHKPDSAKRKRQVDTVFNCLLTWVNSGLELHVPGIAESTGIKVSTVHARINDLKKGYTSVDGIQYWAVESNRVTYVRRGDSVEAYANWTLVTTDPVDREEQKARIINRIKRDAAKLREMKAAEFRELKNLFDE